MWRERLARDENGVVLIYVLFAMVIIGGLVTVFLSRILFETRSTGQARDFESAIHVGEAGAESLFGAINREGEDFAAKVITEAPDGTDHVYTVDTTLSDAALQAAEEAWALDLARQAWTAGPSNLVDTVDGYAYGIRPKKDGVDEALDFVFGVGFVPNPDTANARVRVVKMQIARRFYSPDHALLTGGNLKLGGNAQILAPGCDAAEPDTCNADVHANGNVDVSGSAHLVQGDLTATGAISGSATTEGGTSTGGEQEQPVPPIRARDFYSRDFTYNADPGGQTVVWYDLCPDGTVRARSTTPCSGTQIWPSSTDTSTRFRGWAYRSGTNTWEAKKVEAGVFYVYRADASVNGSAGTTERAVSILVETDSTSATTASKSGSLEMAGNPSLVSALPDTLFILDRDIRLRGTAGGGQRTCDPAVDTCDEQRYTGFISATEQLAVSGTVTLVGSMLAQDVEDLHGLVTRSTAGINGTMNLTYDDDLKIDLAGRVTVEFWNEL